MNICKNCNYFRDVPRSTMPMPPRMYDPTCHHPSALTAKDMVFGHDTYYSCKAMRDSSDPKSCGPSGQHFDPIIPTSAKPK